MLSLVLFQFLLSTIILKKKKEKKKAWDRECEFKKTPNVLTSDHDTRLHRMTYLLPRLRHRCLFESSQDKLSFAVMWKNKNRDVDYFYFTSVFQPFHLFHLSSTGSQLGSTSQTTSASPLGKEDPVVTPPPERTQANKLEEELCVEHPGLLHLNVVCRVHSSREKSSKDDQYCPQVLHVPQNNNSGTVSRLKLNRNCTRNITCVQ